MFENLVLGLNSTHYGVGFGVNSKPAHVYVYIFFNPKSKKLYKISNIIHFVA